MKKILFLLTLFLSITLFGQEECGTDAIHQEKMKNDPVYKAKMEAFEKALLNNKNLNRASSSINKIPVVVHIMHKGEAVGYGTNISDAGVVQMLETLNQRFRAIPSISGAHNIDTNMEFSLAAIDPNGNPTKGINRIDMTNNSLYMSDGVARPTTTSPGSGITDTDLKAISFWDSNNYYNIWLISEINNNEGGSGVQGYAFFPGAHGQTYDGTVILGNNAQNPTRTTFTHELGHAFSLYHTFQGDRDPNDQSTCPFNTNPTMQGDNCVDTPAHIRGQCDEIPTDFNPCETGSFYGDFQNNYMNYWCDRFEFTNDQNTRMQAALSTQRSSFLTSASLTPSVTAPTVNFITLNSTTSCNGDDVKLYDFSVGIPNTYLNTVIFTDSASNNIQHNWTITDENGNQTFSSLQNPTFSGLSTGVYDVTLTITLNGNTYQETKLNYLKIMTSTTGYCDASSPTNQGNFSYSIRKVTLEDINYIGNTYNNTRNLVCENKTVLIAGETYNIELHVGKNNNNNEYYQVYIDFNADGDYDEPNELIGGGVNNDTDASVTIENITFTVPSIVDTSGTNLVGMRVIGSASSSSSYTFPAGTCSSNYFVADVIDFGILFRDPCDCDGKEAYAEYLLNQIQQTSTQNPEYDCGRFYINPHNITGWENCYDGIFEFDWGTGNVGMINNSGFISNVYNPYDVNGDYYPSIRILDANGNQECNTITRQTPLVVNCPPNPCLDCQEYGAQIFESFEETGICGKYKFEIPEDFEDCYRVWIHANGSFIYDITAGTNFITLDQPTNTFNVSILNDDGGCYRENLEFHVECKNEPADCEPQACDEEYASNLADVIIDQFSLEECYAYIEVTEIEPCYEVYVNWGDGQSDVLISGELNTHDYIPGNYNSISIEVKLIDGTICSTATFESVSCNNTNSRSQELKFTMSPNPASNKITVSSSMSTITNKPMLLLVKDIQGNVLHKDNNFIETKTVDVSKFKTGVYFVTLQLNNGQLKTKKLIINK